MPGMTLYHGPSMLDGRSPIVCVLLFGSRNRKTGGMDQTYIFRADVHPYHALATGTDGAVCGGCPWRPQWHDGDTFTGRACYVDLRIMGAIWKKWRAGTYPPIQDVYATGRGRAIRLGTYGDPAAVPFELWVRLLRDARMWTGYTHQWKAPRFVEFKRYCMASVDNAAEAQAAALRGWGTFRVLAPDESSDAVVCPASREAGHRLTCLDCGRCNGQLTNVAIRAHGFGAKFVQLRRAAPPTWRAHYGQFTLDFSPALARDFAAGKGVT